MMGGPAWVTAVNLVIWTGIVLYLAKIDRRMRDLERES